MARKVAGIFLVLALFLFSSFIALAQEPTQPEQPVPPPAATEQPAPAPAPAAQPEQPASAPAAQPAPAPAPAAEQPAPTQPAPAPAATEQPAPAPTAQPEQPAPAPTAAPPAAPEQPAPVPAAQPAPAPAPPVQPAPAKAPEKPVLPPPPPLRVEIRSPVPDEVDRAPLPPHEPRAITLDEAIRIALAYNRSILQSRQGIQVARSNELAAVAAFLPRADMIGTYNKSDGDSTAGATSLSSVTGGLFVTKSETYRGTFQVKENIFSGGQSLMALKSADLGRQQSVESLRQTVQGTVFSVKQAFYGVILAQESLKVAEEAVAQAEEHLRLAQSRFNAGTVSRFDVLRAEVEVANAKPNLIKAKNALKNAHESFKKVLGLDLRYDLSLAGDLKFEPVEVDMDNSIARAMAARPEIIQKRQQEYIEKLNVSSAYARLSPTLDFVANFNRTAAAGHIPGNVDDWLYSWNTSFVLSWNIFEGGLTYSKIWGARATLRSAEWARIDQEEAVRVEVKTAVWGLEESRERIESQAKNVEQAQESLRLAQVRYQNGVGTNVEVIDSEVALTQARTNYIQALYDYTIAKANWEKVVGKD